MKILTVCGSLRAESSSRAILLAYGRVAPSGVVVEHFGGIARLPHFNPDLDREVLDGNVQDWRRSVARADALIVSTPEYVHALPGAFKNALDWLVSDPAVVGKRVVILHAARDSTWALDSLREVLKTMSAQIVESASRLMPLGSNRVNATMILADERLRERLETSMATLLAEMGVADVPPPPAP